MNNTLTQTISDRQNPIPSRHLPEFGDDSDRLLPNERDCAEFEIQAYLWASLKLLGYRVRGEWGFNDSLEKYHRADLLVLLGNHIELAIEVKAGGKSANVKQMLAYRDAGFSGVMCVVGQSHAKKVVAAIETYKHDDLRDEVGRIGATRLAAKSHIQPSRRDIKRNRRR